MSSDNKAIELYRTNLRKGMSKDEAFFAVIDHYNSLHWHDRNRMADEIKQLQARVAKLEKDEA